MEIGESAAQSQSSPQTPDDKKHVKIRVCVFFDGTLNNRTNINQRLAAVSEQDLTEEERRAANEVKARMSSADVDKAKTTYKKFGAPPPSVGENSYEGFYTNVEKMERHLDVGKGKVPGYEHSLKAYIEGAGTLDKEADATLGFAFGMWDSGVRQKVKQGILNVIKDINELDELTTENTVIDLVTLDVFGFSRGAAAARNFIHEALAEKGGNSLKARLQGWGFTVKDNAIQVCFAGLYDTVSTYGPWVPLGLADNVKSLKLDAVRHAQETLHLTSADEHRYHFSLTNIKSAGSRGKEYFLPGVHSDIGGGYRDAATERLILRGNLKLEGILLRGNHPSLDDAKLDRAQLIAAGWYRDEEIKLEHFPGDWNDDEEDGSEFVTLSIERSGIKNHYSRIPLHIMVRAVRNHSLKFRGEVDDDEAVPPELSAVQQRIESYIAGTSRSQAKDWHHNESWLCALRHEYLHFSARMQLGHDPRIDRGRRVRKTYDG